MRFGSSRLCLNRAIPQAYGHALCPAKQRMIADYRGDTTRRGHRSAAPAQKDPRRPYACVTRPQNPHPHQKPTVPLVPLVSSSGAHSLTTPPTSVFCSAGEASVVIAAS